MVVDLQRLSDALRQNSPEDSLRRDLQRIIHARRSEIKASLARGESYVLRVPDGRRIRISPKAEAAAI